MAVLRLDLKKNQKRKYQNQIGSNLKSRIRGSIILEFSYLSNLVISHT